MKEEAPKKIYIPRLISDGKLIHEWNNVPFKKFHFFFDKEIAENIEYTRTDVFIDDVVEKAWDWIDDNILSSNQQDKSGLYCEQFRNYMTKIMSKEEV